MELKQGNYGKRWTQSSYQHRFYFCARRNEAFQKKVGFRDVGMPLREKWLIGYSDKQTPCFKVGVPIEMCRPDAHSVLAMKEWDDSTEGA